LHTIYIDHLGPLPSIQSEKKHFVVIDSFTKFVYLFPGNSTSTREAKDSVSNFAFIAAQIELFLSEDL